MTVWKSFGALLIMLLVASGTYGAYVENELEDEDGYKDTSSLNPRHPKCMQYSSYQALSTVEFSVSIRFVNTTL